jgi:polysaccharide biosynthesis/export protein
LYSLISKPVGLIPNGVLDKSQVRAIINQAAGLLERNEGLAAARSREMQGNWKDRMSLLLWAGLVMGMTGLGCQTDGYYGYPGERGSSQFTPKPGYRPESPAVVQAQYQPKPAYGPQAAPGPWAQPDGSAYPPGMVQGVAPEMGPERGPQLPIPREKEKTYHQPYVIEPPDVLNIDAVRLVPRPPYRIEPMDVLILNVAGTLPDRPISGQVVVTPDGTISLGYDYGVLRISGLTLADAAVAIRNALKGKLADPQVSLGLGVFRGVTQTRGDHLVNMDGTITLGSYGSVCVTGLTLCQAKAAIERHLSNFLLNPEVSVSVSAFNSKYYYVVADGGGYGMQVLRFPITGNETVLDAISNISGLPAVSSTKKIWVARPTPANARCYQILPVHWQVLAMCGDTETNYQLFPGDRIFISADPLLATDNWLAKVFSPIERVLGLALLGGTTYQTFQSIGLGRGTGTAFIPAIR